MNIFDSEEKYVSHGSAAAPGYVTGNTGMGSVGIILLFVFLVILFAVFRGGFGGHDGHYDGYRGGHDGCGRGKGSIADFEAIAQNIQRVPVEQVQLAKDFGSLKEQITLGNFGLSKQISETAAAAELRACQEREAEMRMQITELKSEVQNQKTLAIAGEKFNEVSRELANIQCNMARKVTAQPLVGLNDLNCTNIPGNFFNNSGCSC